MDNILELRCPSLTSIALNIPYEVRQEDNEMYTNDQRAILTLRDGLIVQVCWTNDVSPDITVQKASIENLIDANGLCVSYFGFADGEYVWVSAQVVNYQGEEAVLKDLPRAIKKLIRQSQ